MVHENLRKIRMAKGVTQSHLANKLDITSMSYSRMEKGESKIDVERLKLLAIALETEVGIFFSEELTNSVIKELEFKTVVG